MPITWLPGLLAIVAVQCARKNVFTGGAAGVGSYVRIVLENEASLGKAV